MSLPVLVCVCAEREDGGESIEGIKPGYNIIKQLQLKTQQNSCFPPEELLFSYLQCDGLL